MSYKIASLLITMMLGCASIQAQGACNGVSEKGCELRRAMAKLWSDHVFWTRLYIISALDNKPDLKAATNRLLQNQKDIGAAVATYYGKAAGDKLAQLLKEHILIAADVVSAAKSGNKKKLQAEDAKWHKNADDLAAFLDKANPKNWKEKEMKDMLYNHLKLTTEEVTSHLGKKWEQEVKTFDKVYDQALEMGQGLANGIIAQFPAKF
jgi:hypothetical protein